MTSCMDEVLSQVNVLILEAQGTAEFKRYRSKESVDDRCCLEILRRALIDQTDEAWSVLQRCFSGTIRVWFRRTPGRKPPG
jgi:hypothetical protein